MFTSFAVFTAGIAFLYGWSWLLNLSHNDKSSKHLKPKSGEKEGVNNAKTKQENGFLDEAKAELVGLKAHFESEQSIQEQEKSALMEAVNIAKTETEEKCRLLDKVKTELAGLKAYFESQKSIQEQEKSSLMEAVNIAKTETEEKCKLLNEAKTELDKVKSTLMKADNNILELQRQLNSCRDDLKILKEQSCNQKELLLKLCYEKNELVQSAASAREQAEALATEQSTALTEVLETLQQAVRHAKEEAPSNLSEPEAEEDPVGNNDTLEEWFIRHGMLTRVPPKTWIQLLEHTGFLMEEKASHLREKANSLFNDSSETDDHANNQN